MRDYDIICRDCTVVSNDIREMLAHEARTNHRIVSRKKAELNGWYP